jgi:hypothetical protein
MGSGPRYRVALTSLLAAVLLSNACVSVHMKGAKPERRVTLPGGPGFEKGALTQQALQSTLLTFADRSVNRINHVWQEMSENGGALRSAAETASLQQSGAVLSIASEPSPELALIDMMIYLNLQAWELQQHGPPAVAGVFNQLNAEVWSYGSNVLAPEEADELRAMIAQWKQAHPTGAEVRWARLASMTPIPGKTTLLSRLAKGDPGRMAPIDPQTRTIEESGLLAERFLFLIGRVPTIARWNANLAMTQTFETPEVQTLMYNTDRLARSSTSLARFTDTFPQQVRAGRDAFLADLGPQETAAGQLIGQTQAMLQEARRTSDSMQATLAGVHELLGPRTGEGAGRPFDIEAYTRAAEQFRLAATEANELTRTVGTPEFSSQLRALDAASDRKIQTASGEMKSVIDHAALRAAQVALLIFIMLAVYRYWTLRLQAAKSRKSDERGDAGTYRRAS